MQREWYYVILAGLLLCQGVSFVRGLQVYLFAGPSGIGIGGSAISRDG